MAGGPQRHRPADAAQLLRQRNSRDGGNGIHRDHADRWQPTPIHVETDYAFGGMSPACRGQGIHWGPDPLYGSQVNYERKTPCLLECRPPLGPDQMIAPGASFESFRAFELLHDSTNGSARGWPCAACIARWRPG